MKYFASFILKEKGIQYLGIKLGNINSVILFNIKIIKLSIKSNDMMKFNCSEAKAKVLCKYVINKTFIYLQLS